MDGASHRGSLEQHTGSQLRIHVLHGACRHTALTFGSYINTTVQVFIKCGLRAYVYPISISALREPLP
jgi:Fe-S cluster assembly iron-binding protein IscA